MVVKSDALTELASSNANIKRKSGFASSSSPINKNNANKKNEHGPISTPRIVISRDSIDENVDPMQVVLAETHDQHLSKE